MSNILDLVQVIASTPTFDNPPTCAKPTFVRPSLDYIEFFSTRTRASYGVAKVWAHLVYHAQRNKTDGNRARLQVQREGGRWGERGYWWLTTLDELATACSSEGSKMTARQVRIALDILEHRFGLIEAHQGRHPINGEVCKYRSKTVSHIRLIPADRGSGLDAWPTVTQMRTILECHLSHLIKCHEGHSLVQDSLVVSPSLKGNTHYAAEEKQNPSASTIAPESISKAPGKIKTSKKCEASKPFLDIFLSRKLEWLKVATNTDNPAGCISPYLTDTDRDVCLRFEHQLTKAGIDPVAFMTWLTPFRFQQFAFDLNDPADYSAHWLGTKARQLLLIDHYRQDLAKPPKDAQVVAALCAKWAVEDAAAKAAESATVPTVDVVATDVAPEPNEPVVEVLVCPSVTWADLYDDEPPPTEEAIRQWRAAAAKKVYTAAVPMTHKVQAKKPEPNMFQKAKAA